MELLQKAEQFVVKALEKAENNHDLVHSQKTVYWIKQLKPDADEALLVAGALHDIERAFYRDCGKLSRGPSSTRISQKN